MVDMKFPSLFIPTGFLLNQVSSSAALQSSWHQYSPSYGPRLNKNSVLENLNQYSYILKVFQRRFNGSVDFARTFRDYEGGFGQKNGEFWLGLNTIQEMTSRGKHELRIDLTAADGTHAYELFQIFSLSPGRNYTLHTDLGTETAGDGGYGLHYNSGCDFYTRDSDNGYGCAAFNMLDGGSDTVPMLI